MLRKLFGTNDDDEDNKEGDLLSDEGFGISYRLWVNVIMWHAVKVRRETSWKAVICKTKKKKKKKKKKKRWKHNNINLKDSFEGEK